MQHDGRTPVTLYRNCFISTKAGSIDSGEAFRIMAEGVEHWLEGLELDRQATVLDRMIARWTK